MTAQASLMWFRQDLRLRDNPALTAAANSGPILPVYILDDTNSAPWQLGAASRWWLHQSLKALNAQLNDRLMVLRVTRDNSFPHWPLNTTSRKFSGIGAMNPGAAKETAN